MPDDIKISALTNVNTLSDTAVFPMVQDLNGTDTTLKASMSQVAGKVAEGTTFVNLTTTAKDLVGAINEAASTGGSVDITTEINTPAPVMTLNDGGDNIPLKSLVTEIVPIQSGSGVPSPSNVRAISGHSSINVFNSGKNLIFILYQSSSNLILINGESAYSITLKKGTYTFSATISNACSFNYRKSPGDTTVNIKSFTTTGNVSATFTIDEDMYNCNFFLYSSQGISVSDISNAQLELNDEATTYEAYKGSNTTISLGSTVYGGSLECVNGQGVSEWVNIASYSGETIEEPWLCSEAPFVSGTTPPTGSQVVYKTSTPTSLTVSGANIPTLSGLNNIYSDCGDIQSLEYFNENGNDIDSLVDLEVRLSGRIRTKTYTGDGSVPLVVTFDEVPTMILNIFGNGQGSQVICFPFVYGLTSFGGVYVTPNPWTSPTKAGGGHLLYKVAYSNGGKTMTVRASADDAGAQFNQSGDTYTIYYLV